MSSAENRQALRVSCALPVRVKSRGKTYRGTIQDVSRTGLRLWVPTSELGSDDVGLLALAQLVDQLIGSTFEGDLHYEMLGPLIHKRMQLVRLGQSEAEAAVELGCVFDSPLSDEETGMLGLGLPQVGVTTPDAYREVPRPRRRNDREERDAAAVRLNAFDAYVHPSDGLQTEPLAGETDGMKEEGALVEAYVQHGMSAADLPSLTVQLTQAFGPEPTLEILDGLRMLWSGKADIRRVEFTGPKKVLIHMAGSS